MKTLLSGVTTNGDGPVVHFQKDERASAYAAQFNIAGTATVTIYGRIDANMAWVTLAQLTATGASNIDGYPDMYASVSGISSATVSVEVEAVAHPGSGGGGGGGGGDASAANQLTGNGSLASILSALTPLATKYVSCDASNNATSVKASAGTVNHIRVFNNSANIAYLKLYNKSSSPNPASDTVFDKIMIPGSTSGAGVVLDIAYGQAFSAGIAFAVVNGFDDTDNTSVAASAFSVTVLYK